MQVINRQEPPVSIRLDSNLVGPQEVDAIPRTAPAAHRTWRVIELPRLAFELFDQRSFKSGCFAPTRRPVQYGQAIELLISHPLLVTLALFGGCEVLQQPTLWIIAATDVKLPRDAKN